MGRSKNRFTVRIWSCFRPLPAKPSYASKRYCWSLAVLVSLPIIRNFISTLLTYIIHLPTCNRNKLHAMDMWSPVKLENLLQHRSRLRSRPGMPGLRSRFSSRPPHRSSRVRLFERRPAPRGSWFGSWFTHGFGRDAHRWLALLCQSPQTEVAFNEASEVRYSSLKPFSCATWVNFKRLAEPEINSCVTARRPKSKWGRKGCNSASAHASAYASAHK